uniref:Uncharacterized protein n=1 Tax=Anopheles atroparvus TaxID=41427 RepID=A0AAG5DAP2_ANOAO
MKIPAGSESKHGISRMERKQRLLRKHPPPPYSWNGNFRRPREPYKYHRQRNFNQTGHTTCLPTLPTHL